MNVLVAIPYRENLHSHLFQRMLELSDPLIYSNPGFDVQYARYKDDGSGAVIPGAFGNHARARNALLDKYLKPTHDFVMWIDADLVDYPPDIITRLYNANPGGVTAPVVLIEGINQFYDTYGFVQDGEKAKPWAPYFHQAQYKKLERLVTMDAVGCAYLIPASVYAYATCAYSNRYVTTPGQTEHYSIMRAAYAQGKKVACCTDITIYHANLPRYGEQWHTH